MQTKQSRAIAEYSTSSAALIAAAERMTRNPETTVELLEARATLVQGITACMQRAPHAFPCGHKSVVFALDPSEVKRSLASMGHVTPQAKGVCGAHCTTTALPASVPGNTAVEFTIEMRFVL